MRAICPLAIEGAKSVATRINITTTDPPAPMRWTVDDYHRATDAGLFDDRRVELVDGEIYEMPPMPEPHIAVVRAGAPLKPQVDDVLLLIEVSHATRRFDRGLKLQAYLRDGLKELWIADLVVGE